MNLVVILMAALAVLIVLYKRYVPVYGIPCYGIDEQSNALILDIRDYNRSSKNPVNGALEIPTAYLKRYMEEIPDRQVFVIASDPIEKNFGIRLLQKSGFKVLGYTLTDCRCS